MSGEPEESFTTTAPRQGARLSNPTPLQPYLFVVLDGEDPLASGARYPLANVDLVLLGRGASRVATYRQEGTLRALELRLPGSTLSSAHARILRDGHGFVLEDTRAKNGTFRNGERIKSAPLHDGDIIEIGSTFLRFRAALPAPPGDNDELDGASIAPRAEGFATLLPDLAERLSGLELISTKPITVLFLGETGTGKEVLARAVHTLSARKGPFVAVNSGGLPPTLLEAQLFGHAKGSFTGAHRDEPGTIRSADRGTLFLDEIGDLPLPAQAALLRVLQEREVVPVGGSRPVKVDVRFIAATHKPLQEMVVRGEFRGDLLARLSGFRHKLTPLRDRLEDMGVLIHDILRSSDMEDSRSIRFSSESVYRLLGYRWPFNIRELVQLLSVASSMAPDGVIEPSHLPEEALAPPQASLAPAASAEQNALRQHVVTLLVKHEGKVSEVAREMNKARTQVHRWMNRFGIDPNDYRRRERH